MRIIILLFIMLFSLYASDNCKNRLFTFDIAKNSSHVRVIDIIENLAQKCKFSVKIKDKEAKKQLNKTLSLVHVNDYTLNDMFDFLLSQNNMFYKYNEENEVLSISYLQTRYFIIDYVNLSEHTSESVNNITVGAASGSTNNGTDNSTSSNTDNSGNSDTTTITSKSKFQFWDKLSQEIDALLSRDGDSRQIKSKTIIDRGAGIITVTGTLSQIHRVSRYLDKIKERLHKQVLLETKIIEVDYTDSHNTGIDWSKFQVSLNGSRGQSWTNLVDSSNYAFAYNFSINGLFNFLKKYGKVNLISTPKVLTLNNQPAVINVGKQINYKYQSGSFVGGGTISSSSNTYTIDSVFVGLTLNIIPEISDQGNIILRINPVVSEEDKTNDTTSTNSIRTMPPDIQIKQLSSIVKVKNGSKVIIGGLVSTSKQNMHNKVPILGSIPIVGLAFHSQNKQTVKKELIFVVTPKIVDNKFPSIQNAENLLDGNLNE